MLAGRPLEGGYELIEIATRAYLPDASDNPETHMHKKRGGEAFHKH